MRGFIAWRLARLRARAVPAIDGYTTWYDVGPDYYFARRKTDLPDGAVLAGGSNVVHARSPVLLRRTCAFNEHLAARWGDPL